MPLNVPAEAITVDAVSRAVTIPQPTSDESTEPSPEEKSDATFDPMAQSAADALTPQIEHQNIRYASDGALQVKPAFDATQLSKLENTSSKGSMSVLEPKMPSQSSFISLKQTDDAPKFGKQNLSYSILAESKLTDTNSYPVQEDTLTLADTSVVDTSFDDSFYANRTLQMSSDEEANAGFISENKKPLSLLRTTDDVGVQQSQAYLYKLRPTTVESTTQPSEGRLNETRIATIDTDTQPSQEYLQRLRPITVESSTQQSEGRLNETRITTIDTATQPSQEYLHKLRPTTVETSTQPSEIRLNVIRIATIDTATQPSQEYFYQFRTKTVDTATQPSEGRLNEIRIATIDTDTQPSQEYLQKLRPITVESSTQPSEGHLNETRITTIDTATQPSQEYLHKLRPTTVEFSTQPFEMKSRLKEPQKTFIDACEQTQVDEQIRNFFSDATVQSSIDQLPTKTFSNASAQPSFDQLPQKITADIAIQSSVQRLNMLDAAEQSSLQQLPNEVTDKDTKVTMADIAVQSSMPRLNMLDASVQSSLQQLPIDNSSDLEKISMLSKENESQRRTIEELKLKLSEENTRTELATEDAVKNLTQLSQKIEEQEGIIYKLKESLEEEQKRAHIMGKEVAVQVSIDHLDELVKRNGDQQDVIQKLKQELELSRTENLQVKVSHQNLALMSQRNEEQLRIINELESSLASERAGKSGNVGVDVITQTPLEDLTDLFEKFKEQQKLIEDLQDQLASSQKAIETKALVAKNDLEDAGNRVEDQRRKIEQLESEVHELKSKYDQRLQGEIASMSSKDIAELTQQVHSQRREIETLSELLSKEKEVRSSIRNEHEKQLFNSEQQQTTILELDHALQTERKSLEVARNEVVEAKALLDHVQFNLEQEKDRSKTFSQLLEERKIDYEQAQKELVSMQKENQTLQDKISLIELTKTAVNQSQILEAKDELERVKESFKTSERQVQTLLQEKAALQDQLNERQNQILDTEKRIENILAHQADVRRTWENQQKDWNDQMAQFSAKYTAREEEITVLQRKLFATQNQLEEKNREDESKAWKIKLEQVEQELRKVKTQSASYVETIAQLKKDLASHHFKLQSSETKYSQENSETVELKARVEYLESMAEELQRERDRLVARVREFAANSTTTDGSITIKYKHLQRQHTELQETMENNFQEIERYRRRVRELEAAVASRSDETYKQNYIQSCIKITKLIKDRRILLDQVTDLQQRIRDFAKQQNSSRAARDAYTKLQLMQEQIDRLKDRNSNLTKIIGKLTKLNCQQEEKLKSLKHTWRQSSSNLLLSSDPRE